MPKPAKTRNLGTWTEAKYWGAIRSHLRRLFRHNWEPKKQALMASRRPSQNKARPLLKWEFKCAACGEWFPREEVEIDHIIPCGSLLKEGDIGPFLTRYLPEDVSAYQILCCGNKRVVEEDKNLSGGCHSEKTNAERAAKKSSSA